MSEFTIKLLELLNNKHTCNEICSMLNISNKQLFHYLTLLKNKGLLFDRKYYYNGEIKYIPISTITDLKNYYCNANYSVNPAIITEHNQKNIKLVLISDLHLGNSLERLDLLNKTYDYCSKNGINIILNCGDLIDGISDCNLKNITDIYNQIEYLIKNYPFDKNILNFAVAGNHDLNAIHSGHQDIIEALRNYRHDIVVCGYNNAFINIKNDIISLYHHIPNGKKLTKYSSSIVLHGHAHKYSTDMNDNKVLNIVVPSLSDILSPFPTILELELTFNKGFIEHANIKQVYLAFANKDYVISEVEYNIQNNDRKHSNYIYNEDPLPNKVTTSTTEEQQNKTLVKKPTSQIDKFNARYGLE